MTVANSQVTVQPNGSAQVVGQITNTQSTTHSANISATFYDKAGAVMGVAKGTATDVVADQTKQFTLNTSQNVTNYVRMVVEVRSIY